MLKLLDAPERELALPGQRDSLILRQSGRSFTPRLRLVGADANVAPNLGGLVCILMD